MRGNGDLKWYIRFVPGFMVENARKAGLDPNTAFPGFVVAWIAFFIILSLPVPPGLKPAGLAAAAVAVWAVIMWITEAMPVGVTGLLIPLLLVLTGAQKKIPQAFGGFSQDVSFLVLGSFIFAAIMQSTGLDRRIALAVLSRVKPRVDQVIKGLMAVNIALSLIIPAAVSRSAVLLPIVKGIMELFEETPEGRRARGALAITGLCYFPMVGGILLLTAHMPNVIMAGLFEKELGYQLNYARWFWLHWPVIGLLPVMFLIIRKQLNVGGISVPGGTDFIQCEKKNMGKMSFIEWLVLAIFAVAVLLWITEPQHKIKTGLATLIALGIFFIPGLLPTPWKTLQNKTIWGTWLLLAGALSLASAISATGLSEWIAGYAGMYFKGQHFLVIVVGFIVLTAFVRIFMLSNVAAVSMLAPILISLSRVLNLNPVAFTLLVGNFDTFSFLVPTQVTACVIAYGTGTFDTKTYARVGIPIMVATLLYFVLVMMPWYAVNGLPVWGGYVTWR
ncbi:SLC13 family permease [Desulfofundulus thermosubterraneus]|uniref:Sodium-dependent dicarboxylate transporter SdcS n=1 Tax=Desulfofundulus thermosubterraneus DSM 16057 TaxID=1121432 RepID=A0A1M6GJG5_9FIRM|nr:DASS family sodium-coupled anion symporter [Desulfofundulus thermosubterraneus]SHJ10115.1 anion transporter [Desulfofundulus thermosubterraneus DSM 16057]